MKPFTGRLKPWAIALWLVLWELAARLINREILLVSPIRVIGRFFELLPTSEFLMRCLFSAQSIMTGFLLGAAAGVVSGALAARRGFVKQLLAPLISALRAVPVASFVVLALVWIDKGRLSAFIALIITLPVFYSAALEAAAAADRETLEMLRVFNVRLPGRLRGVYLPALQPRLRAASEVSVGLAWKSGIAAELIAVPGGSIGEKLYYAKVYLETADMLCWTLGAVLISAAAAALINAALSIWGRAYE